MFTWNWRWLLVNNRHVALTLNSDPGPRQSLILSPHHCSSALLHRTSVRFQLHELLGDLVGRSLGQDTHYCHACLVCLNAWPERTPAHAALPVGDVAELNHGHANHPVRPTETVILNRHLELVAVWGLLTQDAAEERTLKINHQFTTSLSCRC